MLFRYLTAMLIMAAATQASAHLHINMLASDTAEDTPLEIGFYGSTTFDIFDTGDRLEFRESGKLLTLTADTTVGTQYNGLLSGLEGMRRANMTNFTTDGLASGVQNLKAPGDRTDPSNDNTAPFGYQIVSVINTETNQPLSTDARVIWRLIAQDHDSDALSLPGDYEGYATFAADSSAADPHGRTYTMPLGTHAHGGSNPDSGFFLFTDAAAGEYEVTLMAVDMSGYFAASAPVTFALHVVPEPASIAALGLGALALMARRRR